MRFFEFFGESNFKLLERGTSNWDYYITRYKDDPVIVVAIAKPGTGAADSVFGTLEYYIRKKAEQ